MKQHKIFLGLLICFLPLMSKGQEVLDVMFYNIYRYPSATPLNRELLLGQILQEAQPDLLMVCELENEKGADLILRNSFGYTTDEFDRATFVVNGSSAIDTLQQMIFFNKKKFTLLHEAVYVTNVRDINRYTLLVNTADVATDSIIIEVFVAHLKSSTGTANVNARLAMTDTIMRIVNTIPSDRYVLVGGDMNFYRSAELGYQNFIDTLHAHPLIDPLGDVSGKWQDDPNFAYMHTQATRTSKVGFGLYGASGGVDDRFDIIFMSAQLDADSTSKLSYVPATYTAYGNNGNCLNLAINDTACVGQYSQTLRQHLHDMSDHLPVTMRFYTPKKMQQPIPDEDTSTSIETYNTLARLFRIEGGNIVHTQLQVSWEASPSHLPPSAIHIYNAMGYVMIAQAITPTVSNAIIDVSHLAAGVYFVKLKEHPFPLKFVKH
jgi:hypothetical protein